MGVLRLLYCDSAGVRRCRAVVHQGQLPILSEDAWQADVTAAGSHLQPTLSSRSGSIAHTPSMLDAAAAGVITLKPRSNRAATLAAAAAAAAAASDASSEDSEAGEFGIRVTPSLTTTPSIAYAAATGFISLPDKNTQQLRGSPLNPAVAAAAAAAKATTAGTAAAAAAGGGGGGSDGSPADSPTSSCGAGGSSTNIQRQSSLASTSSMVHAAAAGVIPRRSSLKPQSSLSNSSSNNLAGGAGGGAGGAGAGVSCSLAASDDGDSSTSSSFTVQPGGLRTTPSMLDAAAAGIITLPRKGSVTFGESIILATAAADYDDQPNTAAAPAAAAAAASRPAAAAAAPAGAADIGSKPGAAAAAAKAKPRPPSPFGSFSSAAAAAAAAAAGGVGTAARVPPAAAAAAAAAYGDPSAAAAAYSIGLTKATMGQPVYADLQCPGTGLSPVGEVLLVPDLSAAVPLPWCPGHSIAPVDMMERDLRTPWSCCPRTALKTALTALEMPHGLSLLVGFELEFVLLKPAPQAAAAELLLTCASGSFAPVDDSMYCQTASLDELAPVLDQIVSTLDQMDVGVVQYHAESAPGQFEVATHPYPALEAVDKLLLSKEAISAVARQHGLQVTFLPKPFPNKAGSGLHCHFSLCQASRGRLINVMTATTAEGAAVSAVPGYPALSESASLFLAGVLTHLPAMLPLTAPSVNSYARLQPCCWSGAFSCWGWDNREAPLRLCCPRMAHSESCNAEFKAFDGSTNPYLGVAAIVAAGLVGLEERVLLPPPVQVDPGAAAAAAATGIGSSSSGSSRGRSHVPAATCPGCPALPRSLTEALDALEEDRPYKDKLEQLLGRDLLKAFLAVRKDEAAVKPGITDLLFKY